MPKPSFLPYGRQFIDEDDIRAVVEVLRSDQLTTGPAVERFERALTEAVGATHAVAVSSGTAALEAACFAAGVGEGDRVVVPAITFVATANCARYLGATPVFADVDPDTGLVTPEEVARVAAGARAIIPVHLTGAPVALPEIREIARGVGACVVEDAAHALGAALQGSVIGDNRHSDMAIFSFHPVKHVTTAEGGAVTCADPALARRMRLFRNHGLERDPEHLAHPSPGPWYYEQQLLGKNYRLSDLHAALGVSQLAKLPGFLARRRALAARYDALLSDALPEVRPVHVVGDDCSSAYHLYSVRIDFERHGCSRAQVMDRLRVRGIGSQVHYIPVPSQPYYRQRGYDPDAFPGAQRFYRQTLSLPLFPAMADGDVERVVDALCAALR